MTPPFIFRSLEKVQQDPGSCKYFIWSNKYFSQLKFLDFMSSSGTILPPLVHSGRCNVVIFSHTQTQDIRQRELVPCEKGALISPSF